jgi:putative FmdB family regulatory protein
MPIYEYLCRGCRHRFEYLRLSSSAPPKCPACESEDLEQLISACAVHSESTTSANLTAAHRKASARRGERLREQHQHLHEHFDDSATHANPSEPDRGTNNSDD